MNATKETIQACADALGLTMSAEFVPWSKSRNAKGPGKDRWAVEGRGKKIAHPSDRSLNWRIMLKHGDRDVVTTDYSAGIGHCPCEKDRRHTFAPRWTVDRLEAVICETERGHVAGRTYQKSIPILPDTADVVHSLIMDADVLNYRDFEDWADSVGYDKDSRTAEKTYQACVAIALKIRAAIGDDGIKALQEAGQDY